MVEQQVAGHEHEIARLGQCDDLLGVGPVHRHRLLDEDVLAGLECLLGQRRVRGYRRGDNDGVELGIFEQILEASGCASSRVTLRLLLEQFRRRIADPAQLGQKIEVSGQVRPPVAQTGDANVH